jgi:hypothetical protein
MFHFRNRVRKKGGGALHVNRGFDAGEPIMPTRRDLEMSDPAPVKPPLGAELWPPRPLDELGMEPVPPPADRVDDLFSQGAALSDEINDAQVVAWVQASRQDESADTPTGPSAE